MKNSRPSPEMQDFACRSLTEKNFESNSSPHCPQSKYSWSFIYNGWINAFFHTSFLLAGFLHFLYYDIEQFIKFSQAPFSELKRFPQVVSKLFIYEN